MALATLKEVLDKADRDGYAVGMFGIFNLEMVYGVIQAAEQTGSPVILGFGEAHMQHANIEDIALLMRKAAQRASIPVVVHFDHGITYDNVVKAIKSGFTSVMIDASPYKLQENIEITREIVKIADALGVSVEAELGHVGGLEAMYQVEYGASQELYTKVQDAAKFVDETGVDALAVAVGTAHGTYKYKPSLDLKRIQDIKKAVNIPLVLHGGSGLSEGEFKSAIKNGIRKINIFTSLSEAGCIAAENTDTKDRQAGYLNICSRTVELIKQTAIKHMQVFGSTNRV
ncbi:MAG: class II fructose-bisphosphate aldolase [Clostridia bacterium]|nr:class II fructose-bisphosphate aldolase [Clostridia bacterium]